MPTEEFDAVVIGAGINGLVSAATLARSGWRMLVLERTELPGGAVKTGAITFPGFSHDLYATNVTQFANSAFCSSFSSELEDFGLRFCRADRAFGSLFADASFLGIQTDPAATDAAIQAFSEHDAAAWQRLTDRFRRIGPSIGSAMRSPMPSLGMFKGLPAARLLLRSAGGFARANFRDPRVQVTFAAWGLHLDFAPGVAGGALFALLSVMGAQANGVTFVAGGVSRLTEALVKTITKYGGAVRCADPVLKILEQDGRAIGVRTPTSCIRARRAVVANLAPKPLSRLVDFRMRRFRHGPGTLMVHLAMSDAIPWIADEAKRYAYVHLAPSLDDLSDAYRSAMRGQPPRAPLLVVAQPSVFEPSRAPAGCHAVSVQVRPVPATLDAAGYAERVIETLERYAPGIRNRILEYRALGPADLEADNPNLVGGDSIGGSHHLSQQLFWRPFLGWSRYRTPLTNLYMVGASTWPGAGTGAISGWTLARMLLDRHGPRH